MIPFPSFESRVISIVMMHAGAIAILRINTLKNLAVFGLPLTTPAFGFFVPLLL